MHVLHFLDKLLMAVVYSLSVVFWPSSMFIVCNGCCVGFLARARPTYIVATWTCLNYYETLWCPVPILPVITTSFSGSLHPWLCHPLTRSIPPPPPFIWVDQYCPCCIPKKIGISSPREHPPLCYSLWKFPPGIFCGLPPGFFPPFSP